MGLTGIHDLDALCHFNGVTHCPWCEKEGTVINHLWTVHYRLGLMCTKCFGLPIHLFGNHLPPWLEGLPTLRRRRPQQVILLSVTTSRRCMRSISPKQEPGWRTWGRFQHPLGCLIGDNLHPIGTALEENQMEEAPPTNPDTSHHLSLPAPRSDDHCLPWIWNCIRCLPEMLNFMNLKLKAKG